MNLIVRLFDFVNSRERGGFMKNEKKFLYVLIRREAHAARGRLQPDNGRFAGKFRCQQRSV
jgi:hypothetical protein